MRPRSVMAGGPEAEEGSGKSRSVAAAQPLEMASAVCAPTASRTTPQWAACVAGGRGRGRCVCGFVVVCVRCLVCVVCVVCVVCGLRGGWWVVCVHVCGGGEGGQIGDHVGVR